MQFAPCLLEAASESAANMTLKDSSRPHRKSVAFSEGATMMDGNGAVTEVNGHSDQTTAENHTLGDFASEAIIPHDAKGV